MAGDRDPCQSRHVRHFGPSEVLRFRPAAPQGGGGAESGGRGLALHAGEALLRTGEPDGLPEIHREDFVPQGAGLQVRRSAGVFLEGGGGEAAVLPAESIYVGDYVFEVESVVQGEVRRECFRVCWRNSRSKLNHTKLTATWKLYCRNVLQVQLQLTLFWHTE